MSNSTKYLSYEGLSYFKNIIEGRYEKKGHTHSYLPLAGGTITGLLSITRSPSVIKFNNSSSNTLGYLGINGDDDPVAYKADGSTMRHILHSANYSNYALPLSGGALTGPLVFNGSDVDRNVIRINCASGDANKVAEWGYTLKFLGSGSGVNNALALYADNSQATTQNLATKWLNDGTMYGRSILPHANNTFDLGNSSYKWKNVYATNFIENGEYVSTKYADKAYADYCASYLHSANRAQFCNPAGVTVEYSTNGGTSWLDYGATNEQKTGFFSGFSQEFYLGKKLSTKSITSDMLRITMDATAMGFYTNCKCLLVNISTNGSSNFRVKVEKSMKGSVDTFSTLIESQILTGWSGWNRIPIGYSFGGGATQTYNVAKLRLTFMSDGAGSSYTSGAHPQVIDMEVLGDTYWGVPHTMAKTGHIYSWDTSGNVIFSKNVTAPTFIGNLTGGADSILSNGYLTTLEELNNVPVANQLRYNLYKNASDTGLGFNSSDGIVLTGTWNSTTYAAQLALDDGAYNIAYRYKSSTWSNWKKLAFADGTGATGTWPIAISGNAKSASLININNSAISEDFPLTFVSSTNTGNQGLYVSTGKSLTFNPSSGNLKATTLYENSTSLADKYAQISNSFIIKRDGTDNLTAAQITSYADLSTSSAGQSAFKLLKSGSYNVARSGSSELLINLGTNTGSASALEFLTNYTHTSRLKVRKIIDSNRVSGEFKELAWYSDIPTIPTSLPANGGNADTVDNKHASDFVLKAGDTMTGSLTTNNFLKITAAASDGTPTRNAAIIRSEFVSSDANKALVHIGSNYGYIGVNENNTAKPSVHVDAIGIYRGVIGVGGTFTYDTLKSNQSNNISLEAVGKVKALSFIENGQPLSDKYQLKGNYATAEHTHSYVPTKTVTFTPAETAIGPAEVLSKLGSGYALGKGTWDYAGNGYISKDTTGSIAIDLAGSSIIQFGSSSAYTQLYITAPASTTTNSKTNEMLFYNNHGSSYSPAWTRVLTNRNYSEYCATKTHTHDTLTPNEIDLMFEQDFGITFQ